MDHREESSAFRQAFLLFDKNDDGKISSDELKDVLSRLGQDLTDAELHEMIREADIDGNGTIEYDEFKTLMAKNCTETLTHEDMKVAFDVFDKDQNGFITRTELKNIATMILGEEPTDDELAKMIDEADMDGDGQVNYMEFARIMMTTSEYYTNAGLFL